ncbi:MAG: butyrate kinase [Alistipes sp.]|nr:butyrate kinase [Alistipes sp.]
MGINLTLTTKPGKEENALTFDTSLVHRFTILAINTGSTSTKIAVYHDDTPAMEISLSHSTEELAQFESIPAQAEWRKEVILKALEENNIAIDTLSAVIGRGGLLRPIESGVYIVTDAMVEELRTTSQQHASNLSAPIAAQIAAMGGVMAYIADPVVVDELMDVARLSGIKQIPRCSIFHALNQKATARLYAEQIGTPYEELNLVVAHLGGGISVAAHRKGLVIDCNNALDGEGPIAPERAGTIPAGALIDLCYSGQYSKKEARALLVGKGGLVALTGSNSVKDIMQRAEAGDAEAKSAIDAMIYTVAKQIGQMAVSLHGEVDAILLTGGIAHSKVITEAISDYCRFLAPIEVYPGENELQALAMNALRVLRGEMTAKNY